ncbi:MAG TPA: hypothetical protein VGL04_02340 [Sporichthyaceae bacterium]
MSTREPGTSGDPTPRDSNHMHRLAYLMLAPTLGRRRRTKLAEAAVHRAATAADPLAALVTEVLHNGGGTGMTLLVTKPNPSRAAGDLDRELGALMPAARVACVLQRVADVDAERTKELLRGAGVADPETALLSVENGAPDTAALLAVAIPTVGPTRGRWVAAGVAAVVLGVAAPVIAVGVGGNHTGPISDRPVSDQHAATATPSPAPTDGVVFQLGQLLTRLNERVKQTPDDAKLLALRDAVKAQLKALRKPPPAG